MQINRNGKWLSGIWILAVMVSTAILLTGCMPNQRVSYIATDAAEAKIDGFGNIRTYLDAKQPAGKDDARQWALPKQKKDVNFLVISGGGAGGAFTVGVLSAWTRAGNRPVFDVVTGVSVGALIAPFAFLGEKYDKKLVEAYTSGNARQLVEPKWVGNGLLGTSLLKPEPLRRMVERYMTADVMNAIAAEHRKGRRLLVLTANLDSQRAVVWNMGAIADNGSRGALKLFRDVLIASASIPGVYPAVLIKAEAGGHTFEEMHSDGGSVSQVLTLPEELMASPGKQKLPHGESVNIYVIVNNALMPEFGNTTNSTLPVIARAYGMLIKSQTKNSLLALYGYAQRTGMHFHVASIDRQVAYSISDPFNTTYMRSVFSLGYSEMAKGTVWKDRPLFP